MRAMFQPGGGAHTSTVLWVGRECHGPFAAGVAEVAKWELSNVGEIAQSPSFACAATIGLRYARKRRRPGRGEDGVRLKRGGQ